jgi:ATP-dependent RNA helicase DDX58
VLCLLTDLQAAKEQLGVTVQISPPTDKGSLLYTQWHSAFVKHIIINIRDDEVGRDVASCANFLKVYNETLLINSDCRCKDALKYLTEKAQPLLLSNSNGRHTSEWLCKLFNGWFSLTSYSLLQ